MSLLSPAPPPTNVHMSSNSTVSIDLEWDAVVNTTGYELDYKEGTASQWVDVIGSTNIPEKTVTDLVCGTSYDFRVRAWGDGTNYESTWGAWSGTVTESTAGCP